MLKATKIHFVHALNHQKIAKMEEEPLKTERICFGFPLKGSFHCSGGKNLRHLVTLPPQSGDKREMNAVAQLTSPISVLPGPVLSDCVSPTLCNPSGNIHRCSQNCASVMVQHLGKLIALTIT